MSDESISGRIESLVDEEHAVRAREQIDSTRDEALSADRERLAQIKVALDRCWDLLRQGRARRSAGDNPDDVDVRDAATVESYLQ